MKILIGTPYFYPEIGGLENYAYKLAKGLQDKFGWEVIIVTSSHGKMKKDVKENLDGMMVYRLKSLFQLSNTPVNPFWLYKIWRIIKIEKPDIINAHTPVPFMADVLSMVSLNIPFVLTYHATSLYKAKGSLFNAIVWIYKQIENLLFNRADKIITVSRFVADMLPKRYEEKISVVNNFIDQEVFVRETGKKDNNIIFVGSLDKTHSWKGLDKLIDATKLVINFYKRNITLQIIGEGSDKNTYVKMVKELRIEKNVKFLGKKVGKEKNSFIKKAKIAVVYPKTSNDALPTFLLEAWANKTSVIASDIYPISKIVKDDTTGKLVEPNNSSKLATEIVDLLEDTNKRKKLEANGYKHVKELYNYNNELKKFDSLLRKATN